MMHGKLLTIVFCNLLLLALISFTSAHDINNSYQFAFAYQATEEEIGIILVDPTTSKASSSILLPVEKGWTLANVAKSTGSKWIALVFRHGRNQVVRLVNLKTNEMRSVASNIILASVSDTIMGPLHEIAWSPDGQYLVLNLFKLGADSRPDTSRTDTVLYSVQNDELVALTNDDDLHTGFVWSPDSRQLAVTTVKCSKDCVASIDLFDANTYQAVASVNITPDVFGANSMAGAGICHLDWSLDARYISFMANCDSLEYGYYKEIYILEIAQQKITQVTNFSFSQDIVAQNGFLFADYHPVWLDQNNLVISTIYGLADNVHAQTLNYNVSTQKLTKISNQFVKEWAVNQSSHLLAFQNLGTNPDAYQNPSQSQVVDIASVSSIQQANTETNELPTLASFTAGCNLVWSPDGSILAYSVPKDGRCGDRLQSLIFVNNQNKVAIPYTPGFEGYEPLITFAIGWILVN